MVRLLIYGYTTGIRSSRPIERKCADNVAFRFLAADQAPDFRSIARFRRRHLHALADLFLQSLHLAQKLGMVKLGRVALDGTKLEASASKHKAMSYGRLVDKEERLEAEIAALEARAEDLIADAEATDEAEDEVFGPDGKDVDLPAELTAGRSAWPSCRPPARRSRPKRPRRLAATRKTKNAAARSAPAAATSSPSPTRARRLPPQPGPSPRPRPTSPTPTRGS
jgi:hypothetical protein